MGTRSLTWVYETYKDEDGSVKHEPIIKLYRQYDGYVSGHGLELAEWLGQYRVVNGLGMEDGSKVANGMGCLAAQLVAHFKDGPGQFYLHAPVMGRDHWQEYEYHIYADKVLIERQLGNFIFEGTWAEFNKYCLEEAIADEKAMAK
jgi:hypothetical protein